MNFSLAKIKKSIKESKAKINKEILTLFFSVAVFLYIFCSVFLSFKVDESEISKYMESFKSDNNKYEYFTGNASVNIKNLVENSHVKSLKHYDELIDEISYSKREDPYSKANNL